MSPSEIPEFKLSAEQKAEPLFYPLARAAFMYHAKKTDCSQYRWDALLASMWQQYDKGRLMAERWRWDQEHGHLPSIETAP
jgi:hypothetical protein